VDVVIVVCSSLFFTNFIFAIYLLLDAIDTQPKKSLSKTYTST